MDKKAISEVLQRASVGNVIRIVTEVGICEAAIGYKQYDSNGNPTRIQFSVNPEFGMHLSQEGWWLSALIGGTVKEISIL